MRLQGSFYSDMGNKGVFKCVEQGRGGVKTSFALVPLDKVTIVSPEVSSFDSVDVICTGRTVDDVEFRYSEMMALFHWGP